MPCLPLLLQHLPIVEGLGNGHRTHRSSSNIKKNDDWLVQLISHSLLSSQHKPHHNKPHHYIPQHNTTLHTTHHTTTQQTTTLHTTTQHNTTQHNTPHITPQHNNTNLREHTKGIVVPPHEDVQPVLLIAHAEPVTCCVAWV